MTDSRHDYAAEWQRLQKIQVKLRSALANAQNEQDEVELRRRLLATREAIDRIEAGGYAPVGAPSGSTASTVSATTSGELSPALAAVERRRTLADDDPSGEPDDIDAFLNRLETQSNGSAGSGRGPFSAVGGGPQSWHAMLAWGLVAVSISLVLTYVLSLLLVPRPEDGYITVWDGWIYHLAIGVPAGLALLRAVVDRRGRWAWILIAVGILLFTGGGLLFTYRDQNLDPVPFPGWSDVLYLESTLALVLALGLVTQRYVRGASRTARLNGLVVGLAAGSIAVALWFNTILEQSGSTAAVVVGLAYPLFDLVLIVIALSGLSLARYRPSPAVAAFIAAAVVWAVGDIVFLRQIADDTYLPGTLLEATWVVGILLFALACWLPQHRPEPNDGLAMSVGLAVVPWVAALAALGVIGWSVTREVPPLAVWLAMASLVVVLLRIGLTVRELTRANEAFSQVWIGEVAGLGDYWAQQEPQRQPAMAGGPPGEYRQTQAPPPSAWLIVLSVIAVTALVGVGVLLWQVASNRGLGNDTVAANTSVALDADGDAGTGTTEAPLAESTTTDAPSDTSLGTVAPSDLRAANLQTELERLQAFTPIVFESGQRQLSDNNVRVLNNVAALLLTSPGIEVSIIGYTDDDGSAATNQEISTARANAVRDYLISQGVPADDLVAIGRGQSIASGTLDQSGLERRVELVVTGSSPQNVGAGPPVTVGLVAPSASNDLASTQSMVDALDVLGARRDGMTVEIVDNTIVPRDAADVMRRMADEGHQLIIAHDPQLGSVVNQLAIDYPDVVFAWGPTTQVPELPNLYTYSLAAEEGGYVLGALASETSQSGVIGVVGPIEAGDAQRYVSGFVAGAGAERPEVQVLVDYAGSFLDATLAASLAADQIDAGADVLTSTGPLATGPADVAANAGVRWMGNQVDQSVIDPALVIASQVYHWEVPIRQILDDIDQGRPGGRAIVGSLADGGITIELNPSFPLDGALIERANQLIGEITSGTIDPPSS